MSLKKMEKKKGPSIEPCGTPERTGRGVDMQLVSHANRLSASG